MKMSVPLAMVILLAAPAVEAQQRRDQARAMEARRTGRLLPLPEIERRVVPTMKGAQYLGVDFDGEAVVYTLKFLRDGTVIWIEVDGESGKIVGRSDK